MIRHAFPFLLALALFGAGTACAQPAEPATATASTPTLTEAPDLARAYAATITPEDLAAYLYVFASDFFEGRETATRGQKLAALYLAGQYRKLGLTPMGTVETDDPMSPEAYFQPFPLEETRIERATFTVLAGGEPVHTSTFGRDGSDGTAYIQQGRSGTTEGPVVFAGYGIQTDGFDEIEALRTAGIDLTDKWVLLLDDEPLTPEGRSRLTDDGEPTDYSRTWYRKFMSIYRSGLGYPAGILVVADRSPLETRSVAARAEMALGALGALSLPGSGGGGFGERMPPIFFVTSEVADAALGGRSVAELQAQIDAALAPTVFEVTGTTIRGEVEKETRTVTTENVAAFIEGSDPVLKDEVVVLSSHYDHIGMDPFATGDGINNGADDDGSGTVALLEIAEAFMEAKAAGHGPRRSLLFLSVSGEEKGLLGSAYYADTEPLLPLEQTVTNLNIDMIGRHDPTYPGDGTDYVYVIGSKIVSDDLDRISHDANRLIEAGLDLNDRFNTPDDPNQFYRRSDHWNFGKHRIPFVFYFTGTHEDYHGVGDEPHKIDYPRMARISQLIFATAWQIANQDARPALSGSGFWDDEG